MWLKALEDLYAFNKLWNGKRWRESLKVNDIPASDYNELVSMGYAEHRQLPSIDEAMSKSSNVIWRVIISALGKLVRDTSMPIDEWKITPAGIEMWEKMGLPTWVDRAKSNLKRKFGG